MGSPPYQQIAITHKDFTKQCPVAVGTTRCRRMRSCDYASHQKANPNGSKEVEYLIHNLTGRAGELKAETRKQMTRRLHELSDCSKHQDAAVMEESVRKTLEQLENAERFIAMASGVSDGEFPKAQPTKVVPRPETSVVSFATSGGLPTPPASARTSLESAEDVPRPSTAEQAHIFWGVPPQKTPPQPTNLKSDSPQTPPKSHHQASPPPAPAARRRTTGPIPSSNLRSLLDTIPPVPTQTPSTTSYLTRIHQLEAENIRLREELTQANRRAEVERDIAKAARRAASQWKAHYERYKAEVWAFFRQTQRVEDREPWSGGLEEERGDEEDDGEVDDGYGSEE